MNFYFLNIKIAIERLRELISTQTKQVQWKNKIHRTKISIISSFMRKKHWNNKRIPCVYAYCGSIIKRIFDNYMKLMIKELDKSNAENLINKCNEKSEEIVK